MSDSSTVIERVRKALGRTAPLASAPVPPTIDEPVTRLVHTDFGLPELFAKSATELKMLVTKVYVEELISSLVTFLKEKKCRRIAMPDSPFLEKLDVPNQLRESGFEVRMWSQITLDDAYDFDTALTDVWKAVAETGTLVIRASATHGRVLSLVPFIHIAILEPKNFLPDMLDLFELLAKEGTGSATCLIAGPSKTADIEMNVVTGVHGPNIVHAFILQ